jgi:antitoxin component YwqK of YwqJK toxin-antitoxin module
LDYTYYSNGRLDHEDRFYIEGAEYESSTWRYDASGKLTREEWDDGANGVADRLTDYAYDACGNLLDHSVSREEGDPVSTEHWRYDADGHLRRYEWNNTTVIEGLPDDLVDIFQSTGFESWQYDADGRLKSYQGECEGGGCSFDYYQFINQIVNYEYDDDGNLARELVDLDGDGRPDRVTVYEYDAAGSITRQQTDTDGDGSADQVESHEYDDTGNISQELYYENGERGPRQVSYEYGDDNRLTRREDIGADGKLNSIDTLEYDAQGNLLRQASTSGDGYEYGISVYTYDAMGNRTRTEEDGDGDGVVDTIRSWEYGADGNLVLEREVSIDQEAHRVEFSHSYQYDADSNLVRESEGFDWDGDGVPEEDETRHYTRTGWGHFFFTDPAAR